MSRKTLAKKLGKETGWAKEDFLLALDCLVAYAVAELKRTGKAEIPGLVKFRVNKRASFPEHTKVNNFTGELIPCKARPESYWVRAHVPTTLTKAVVGDGKNVVHAKPLRHRLTRKPYTPKPKPA